MGTIGNQYVRLKIGKIDIRQGMIIMGQNSIQWEQQAIKTRPLLENCILVGVSVEK